MDLGECSEEPIIIKLTRNISAIASTGTATDSGYNSPTLGRGYGGGAR